jgi:hypothetical protein
MAANCKNTASLSVLCWQDNWTPDIDQKKAPTLAEAEWFCKSALEIYCHSLTPAIHHMG